MVVQLLKHLCKIVATNCSRLEKGHNLFASGFLDLRFINNRRLEKGHNLQFVEQLETPFDIVMKTGKNAEVHHV